MFTNLCSCLVHFPTLCSPLMNRNGNLSKPFFVSFKNHVGAKSWYANMLWARALEMGGRLVSGKKCQKGWKRWCENCFSTVTMATIRAQEWLGRKTKNKPAVTKYQQKGIKNFLRFPIKRDYCNKFESLVATPYPMLWWLWLSLFVLSFFSAISSRRHGKLFPSFPLQFCVVKDDKNFYIFSVALLAHTNCRALNKYLYFHQRRYGRHRETTKKRRIKKEMAAEKRENRVSPSGFRTQCHAAPS